MAYQRRKWTLEELHHLDVLSADLDALRDAVTAIEAEYKKADAGGRLDEFLGIERDLARLQRGLRLREAGLV